MSPYDESLAQLCSGCDMPIRPGARFCASCGLQRDTPSAGNPLDITSSAERPVESSISPMISAQWSELTRIAWLYGLMLFGSLVVGWVSRFERSPWPTVTMMAFDAVLVVGYAATRRREILALLRFPQASPTQCLRIAAATAACALVIVGYFALMESAGIPMLELTEDYVAHGWPTWSVILMLSVMPGLFEELGFRGVIQCTLERVLNAGEALIIQAALFSIVHLSPVIFASHFLMGFYLGWLRNETRSLYPGMIAHASWNAYWVAQELY